MWSFCGHFILTCNSSSLGRSISTSLAGVKSPRKRTFNSRKVKFPRLTPNTPRSAKVCRLGIISLMSWRAPPVTLTHCNVKLTMDVIFSQSDVSIDMFLKSKVFNRLPATRTIQKMLSTEKFPTNVATKADNLQPNSKSKTKDLHRKKQSFIEPFFQQKEIVLTAFRQDFDNGGSVHYSLLAVVHYAQMFKSQLQRR
jgi:hypothetical protein